MDERGAVELKSGETVHQSVPGLRRPTSPPTAGRKSAARPSVFEVCTESRVAGLRSQPKTGRGAGQSPAISDQREALYSVESQAEGLSVPVLEVHDIRLLLEFFTILDRWDREAHEV
jgi:hypothetical protein